MQTHQASIVFRALSTLTVAAALVLLAAACQSTSAPDGDGGPAPAVTCSTQSDCPSGTSCSFEIDLGCAVGGECRILPLDPDADTTQCAGQAGPACACNGQTIQVLPCWDFLAPMAVSAMGACGSQDAGAGG